MKVFDEHPKSYSFLSVMNCGNNVEKEMNKSDFDQLIEQTHTNKYSNDNAQ
jgi:hypothetical protein